MVVVECRESLRGVAVNLARLARLRKNVPVLWTNIEDRRQLMFSYSHLLLLA